MITASSNSAGTNSHSFATRERSTSIPVTLNPCSKPALAAGLFYPTDIT
jgi:hypothetical protein